MGLGHMVCKYFIAGLGDYVPWGEYGRAKLTKQNSLLLGLLRGTGTAEPVSGEKLIIRWMAFISFSLAQCRTVKAFTRKWNWYERFASCITVSVHTDRTLSQCQ